MSVALPSWPTFTASLATTPSATLCTPTGDCAPLPPSVTPLCASSSYCTAFFVALPIWLVTDVLRLPSVVLRLFVTLVLSDDRPPFSCPTFTASVFATPAATLCSVVPFVPANVTESNPLWPSYFTLRVSAACRLVMLVVAVLSDVLMPVTLVCRFVMFDAAVEIDVCSGATVPFS